MEKDSSILWKAAAIQELQWVFLLLPATLLGRVKWAAGGAFVGGTLGLLAGGFIARTPLSSANKALAHEKAKETLNKFDLRSLVILALPSIAAAWVVKRLSYRVLPTVGGFLGSFATVQSPIIVWKIRMGEVADTVAPNEEKLLRGAIMATF